MLFNESFVFTLIASSNVRILSLDQEFFVNNQDSIEGLKECMLEAEEYVEQNGIPICDFKIFSKTKLSPLKKFKRAVEHVKILGKLN